MKKGKNDLCKLTSLKTNEHHFKEQRLCGTTILVIKNGA